MRAFITLISVEALHKVPDIFSIGGFTMVSSDGRTFSFDFEDIDTAVSLEESTEKYVFNCRLKGRDVDVCIDENNVAGVDDDEITPEFIATSTFDEICYECYFDVEHEIGGEFCPLEVLDFSIEEEGKECKEVPPAEIERYNNQVRGRLNL